MNLSTEPSFRQLQSRKKTFSLEKPGLVGVLNLTPDSFSDGGQFTQIEKALAQVRRMLAEGADWIDVGGESSGPGSVDVSLEEELRRVLPIVEAIRRESSVWLSVDTYKAEVARQALAAGADAINDVTALRGDPQMAAVVAQTQVPLVLMYSKDPNARTTREMCDYQDVVQTVKEFFRERIAWALAQGLRPEQIVLDPGMGFFVSGVARYSFQLLQRLGELSALGYPLLVGPSRKSFLAQVSPGRTLGVHERLIPSLVTAAIALWEGALLVRLHDVAEGRLMLDTLAALRSA